MCVSVLFVCVFYQEGHGFNPRHEEPWYRAVAITIFTWKYRSLIS